jgi:hypothetical protein
MYVWQPGLPLEASIELELVAFEGAHDAMLPRSHSLCGGVNGG